MPQVNLLLAKHGYLLRIFELKNKFCHLTLKIPKNKILLDNYLLLVVLVKNNGFHVISTEYSKKLRKKLKPIDIIYKPVKSPHKQIHFYYFQDIKIV